MLQLGTGLFYFLLVGILTINGQDDACPNGLTTNASDPRWRFTTNRFEIITEMIFGSDIAELSQTFSSYRDAVLFNSRLGIFRLYWNFDTKEYFEVGTVARNQSVQLECTRQPVTVQSQTSVIAAGTAYLKPSVLLGFNAVNVRNPNWRIVFKANSTLRGVPTQQFESCFYVDDIQATVNVTYHAVNEQALAVSTAENQSIILQFDVTVSRPGVRTEKYIYNVFRFVPNPGRGEQRQSLETPAGVYCPGRDKGLAVPQNIPERVSSNSEAFIPEAGASIVSSHGLYDTEAGFTRADYWYADQSGGSQWQHYTEIHDFFQGLSYNFNQSTRQCRVSDIQLNSTDAQTVDGKPSLIQIATPQHFFLLDDIEYQYTGEKPCRDHVMCHVWIGRKMLPNNQYEQREWYWAFQVNNIPLDRWFPSKFIWKRYDHDYPVNSYEINIFNYRQNPYTIFEIDYTLAECYRALGPANGYNLGVLSFRINNEQDFPVLDNLNYLRFHIWETLLFTLFVRPIRISQLIVDKDGNDIVVTFTLLDAPPRKGPVENLFNETSLDTLIERLRSVIDSNGLIFRARAGSKQVILRARADSLNLVHQSTEDRVLKSGGKITTFWIIFILVGIIIGIIGGFLALGFIANRQ